MKIQRYTMTFSSAILDSEEMLSVMLNATAEDDIVREIEDVLYAGDPIDVPASLEEQVIALGKRAQQSGRRITPVPKPQKRQKGKARR